MRLASGAASRFGCPGDVGPKEFIGLPLRLAMGLSPLAALALAAGALVWRFRGPGTLNGNRGHRQAVRT